MNEITAHIDSSGRLVVPAVIRRSLGLNPGAAVTLRVADGELRVVARSEAVRLAQERVRRHVASGRKLSAELIAERKARTSWGVWDSTCAPSTSGPSPGEDAPP